MDLSATQTRLTPPSTWCCCSPTIITTTTSNTTHNSDDKRDVKRILQQLKDEAEIEKASFDLKYKKIKHLEEYLSLE
ncbi:hypothetical protein RO3G_14108 [Rhizopus delemar RA 99-880]|uniref:Uncharacterized protein n=1 Tax=Rhizopus delemar (strain RA 99-880 / ATCC MYA-4621 / FGSC 9543 / NRRL 43880) TaxID=246409 RepID=I1CLR7_RHIO9|nr:hypothetical protein RO3G_14108 [Rhizopus delemar RA 99-880]|eukprot:EIE89397.1 hypothetical protein RO3G_14108 [Rhizopus delemar RA 99-880]